MYRKFVTLCFVLLYATTPISVFAETFDQEWDTILQTYPQFSPAQQAGCIADSSGTILFARNPDMQIIPASVSKIYLEDFALSKLGLAYTYKTTLIRNDTTLYINGALDPFFTDGDLKKFILATNKQLVNQKIEHVVFTNTYFNWSTNQTETRINLEQFVKRSNLFTKKGDVKYRSTAYTGKGKLYTFTSAPLSILFKQMNIYSTNSSSHAIFLQLGGKKAFQKYMKDTYNAGTDIISFDTGSGIDGNTTTCALTLRVLKHLHTFLLAHNVPLEDFLVFPGLDGGSMRNRMKGFRDEKLVLVKPGFIYNHETLTGVLKTQSGYLYFGVFASYPDIKDTKAGRDFVDLFVEKLLSTYHTLPFSYTQTSYNQDAWTKIR